MDAEPDYGQVIVPTSAMQQAVLRKLVELSGILDRAFPVVDHEDLVARFSLCEPPWSREDGKLAAILEVSPRERDIQTLLTDFGHVPATIWVAYDAGQPLDPIRIWWAIEPSSLTRNARQDNYWPYGPVISYHPENGT
jgi:hypothetical protein